MRGALRLNVVDRNAAVRLRIPQRSIAGANGHGCEYRRAARVLDEVVTLNSAYLDQHHHAGR